MQYRNLLIAGSLILTGLVFGICSPLAAAEPGKSADETPVDESKLKTATFGTGCFWCTEGIFEQLKGVYHVTSGYSGGRVPNPTYQMICTGATGHAEVVQFKYDPDVISFDTLLEAFWKTHDPTTLNRQGIDVGPQYRSVIFYHDDDQKKLAEHYKQLLNANGAFNRPVVTEITEFSTFYPAEDYHQDYFEENPYKQYCRRFIKPKVSKFKKVFKDKLKDS